MPRNGAGIYSTPLGTDGVSNATIASTPYNANVHDVEQDLNTPRPIVAGGTGAVNAHDARANVGAEVSSLQQQVTNYDTQIWESGSFASAMGAIAAPTATEHFMGAAVILNSNPAPNDFITLRAVGHNTGLTYTRQKKGAVGWTLWSQNAANDADYVHKTGDTMSGALVAGSGVYFIAGGANSIFQNSGRTLIRGASTGVQLQAGDGTVWLDVAGGGAAIGAAPGSVPGFGNTTTGTSILSGALVASHPSSLSLVLNKNSDGGMAAFCRSGAQVGGISVTTTTTAFNTSSDGRLKEDIHALSTTEAGNIIDDTEVYNFRWKGGTEERSYGVIAQQAAPVYAAPAFHDTDNDRWFVDYSKYVPVILRELQALRARVAQLEGGLASKPA